MIKQWQLVKELLSQVQTTNTTTKDVSDMCGSLLEYMCNLETSDRYALVGKSIVDTFSPNGYLAIQEIPPKEIDKTSNSLLDFLDPGDGVIVFKDGEELTPQIGLTVHVVSKVAPKIITIEDNKRVQRAQVGAFIKLNGLGEPRVYLVDQQWEMGKENE